MSKYGSIFITEEEKKAKILKRTYTERFEFLMGLIRINKVLQNARIQQPKK